MDTIAFDGVEYVKASVAAKRFRYTSDYIGQLCRSKKIDARLVGRTWFVNVDSIETHRKNKHKKVSAKKAVPSSISIESKSSRVVVPPVLKSKTAQAYAGVEGSGSETRTLKVSYDQDEESLLPTLTKKKLPTPKTIRIEQVNPSKVKIVSSNKSKTSFLAEKLPDVALSGRLSVGEYLTLDKPVDETAPNVLENKDNIQDFEDVHKETEVTEAVTVSNDKVETKIVAPKPVLKMASASTMVKVAPVQEVKSSVMPKFTPTTVQVQSLEVISPWVSLSPLIATFCAIATSAFIWSASSSMVAFESFSESGIIFQMANLIDVLDL